MSNVRAAMAEHQRVLLVSATGSGKTQIFSYIARSVQEKNKRVLILAHRRELIRQISAALSSWGVNHGVMDAGAKHPPRQSVIVGSVFTVVRRVQKMVPPDLIICDESHHMTPRTTWGKVAAAFPNARVLGVTATPCRLGGEPMADSFDVMVKGPPISELIAEGYLTPTEVYAPSKPDLSGIHKRMGDYVQSELAALMEKPRLVGSAVTHYKKICPDARALAFCVSVLHAKMLADEFNAAGVSAAAVDGAMYEPLRDSILQDFRDGKIKVVTSCDLLTEGLDIPVADCAILLRPTQSLGLYLQMVGRAIRIAPGKIKTIVLDHASCTVSHGFVEEHREWSLDGTASRKKSTDKPPAVRTCAKCFCAHRPSPTCPRCGYEYPIQSREVEQVDGELALITDPKRINRDELLAEPARAKEYSFMLRKAREKGYKDAWAWHVVAAKEAKRRMRKVAAAGGGG